MIFPGSIFWKRPPRPWQTLFDAGKVRYFGVSNHNPAQIELLQRAFGQKLLFNQMQVSVAHTPLVDSGMAREHVH